jgi:hypothetical protein
MSVDELMNFIESNNDTNYKTKKQKNKKNDKFNKLSNSNPDQKSDKEIENEIENFKTRLRLDSVQFRSIIKKKTSFTRDWIISL